ncbi:MAG: aspartate carbamoyltransferase catalytic subunit [Planctomycetota bacterium]
MTETPKGTWTSRHLLGLEELSKDEILAVLETARGLKEISTRSVRKTPALRGRVVVNLFFEPSTRTRTSFELAAQRLSADTIEFTEKMSATRKGETLIDTARNIEAMGVDILVVRHASGGAPWIIARNVNCSVVNAGDGQHEHPTQGLLDIFTMREHLGDDLAGKHVAFVGDISHSRVARSNLFGLTKLGAHVHLIGPRTLVPAALTHVNPELVHTHHHLDEVLPELDVINLLRIQLERQGGANFPSLREYTRLYGITKDRMKRARPDVLIMHPGPINRGVEISPDVADGNRSVILEQVSNGLAVRMAVLWMVVNAQKPAAAAVSE